MDTRGATLSEDQWTALGALLTAFDDAAHGRAKPLAYLATLDPGIGKTTAIVSFLAALDEAHANSTHPGALVCVERIDQARDVRDQIVGMRVCGTRVGFWTSEEKSDALDSKPILLTTHERVRRLTKSRPLREAHELYFEGDCRSLRIWDETFSTTRPINANKKALGEAIGLLSKFGESDAAEALAEALTALKGWKDRTEFDFPDWVRLLHHTHVEDYHDCALGYDLGREMVLDLAAISGKQTRVCRHGSDTAALHYRPTLPKDIYPVVVTDASGRIRQQYADQERLGVACQLPSARKMYRNLTVNFWPVSGSKTAWRKPDRFAEYVQAIANTINTKPNEKWLVVHHKAENKIGRSNIGINDVPKELKRLLNQPSNVSFLNWGRHTATNEHLDVPNVILAGTLFYPEYNYESMKRASAELSSDEEVSSEERAEVRLGEHGHHILQALCRASVRLPNGGDCGACEAWVMAAPNTGIRHRLPEWFPGAKVQTWVPIGTRMAGEGTTQADRLVRTLADLSPGQTLTFPVARGRLGVSKENFRKLTKKEKVIDSMYDLGVSVVKCGQAKAFSKAA